MRRNIYFSVGVAVGNTLGTGFRLDLRRGRGLETIKHTAKFTSKACGVVDSSSKSVWRIQAWHRADDLTPSDRTLCSCFDQMPCHSSLRCTQSSQHNIDPNTIRSTEIIYSSVEGAVWIRIPSDQSVLFIMRKRVQHVVQWAQKEMTGLSARRAAEIVVVGAEMRFDRVLVKC